MSLEMLVCVCVCVCVACTSHKTHAYACTTLAMFEVVRHRRRLLPGGDAAAVVAVRVPCVASFAGDRAPDILMMDSDRIDIMPGSAHGASPSGEGVEINNPGVR